jgi:hypothetical protein
MDFFKKTDAGYNVVQLAPNSSGMPWFGQWFTLEKGKTYTFSNYYLAGTDLNCRIYYKHNDNQYNNSDIEGKTVYDNEWSKHETTFTVPNDAPDDGNGKTLIWVGIRGNKSSQNLYYYDFNLYDVENPQVNLFRDAALLENGAELNVSVWKTAGGEISAVYSKVTLESIGGMNTFISYQKKCDVNNDGIVDIRDLVRMKRYQDNETTDANIPEGRGDLDNDKIVAGESDLLLLKKELLK